MIQKPHPEHSLHSKPHILLALALVITFSLTLFLHHADASLIFPFTTDYSDTASMTESTSPLGITTGSFFGDGNLDLAVTDFDGDTISIFKGDGTGNFVATAPYVGLLNFSGIAAGNFTYNFSGYGAGAVCGPTTQPCKDLAVAARVGGGSASGIILIGNGSGGFVSSGTLLGSGVTTGSQIGGVALGDFNHDGYEDVAITKPDSGTVEIWENNHDGTGTFTLSHTYTLGGDPTDIVAGDFAGNGWTDLAVSDPDLGTVVYLMNTGTAFTPNLVDSNSGAEPGAITVGSFGGDINLAVVNGATSGPYANTISLYPWDSSTAKFTLGTTIPVGNGPSSIVAGDFNGDGYTDLAVTNQTDSTVTILKGNSSGTFTEDTPAASLGALHGPVGITAADFNGDGYTDLATANTTSYNVSVLLAHGPYITGVDSVSSSGCQSGAVSGNGYYSSGKVICLQVHFNQPVTYSGPDPVGYGGGGSVPLVPGSLALNRGVGDPASALILPPVDVPVTTFGADPWMTFTTSTLDLTYTVGASDTTQNLDYLATNSLSLGSGPRHLDDTSPTMATLKGADGMNANLTLPTPGGVGDLAYNNINTPIPPAIGVVPPGAIVIDTTAPVLTEVTPIPSPTNNPTPSYTFTYTDTNPGDVSASNGCTINGVGGVTVLSVNPGLVGSVTTTVTFAHLADGTYHCTLVAADDAGNENAPFDIDGPSGFTIDATGLTLSPDPTYVSGMTITNHNPIYDFGSSEAGTITSFTPIGSNGMCPGSGSLTPVFAGSAGPLGANPNSFPTLADGTYTGCQITVHDLAENSASISIPPFTVADPVVTSGSGSGGGTSGGGGGGVVPSPALSEIMPVTTPTENHTPSYTLSANESGTLAYGGDCSSATTFVQRGNTTITFSNLSNGTHTNCTITLVDSTGSKSVPLAVSPFSIYTISLIQQTVMPPANQLPTTTNTSVTTISQPTPTTTPQQTQTPKPKPKPALKPKPVVVTPPVTVPTQVPVPSVVSTSAASSAVAPAPVENPEPVPVAVPAQAPTMTCAFGLSSNASFIQKAENWLMCVFKPLILGVRQFFASWLMTPSGALISVLAVAVLWLLSALITVLYGIFSGPITFGEAYLVGNRVWTLFLAGLGIKKHSRFWGVVYDSATKATLDPVRVVLASPEGVTLYSTVTDLEGRFQFDQVKPGNYALVAQKPGYHFPSEKLVGADHDVIYTSLYFGEFFTVGNSGQITIRNIPMDPERPDTDLLTGKPSRAAKYHAAVGEPTATLAGFMMGLGFFATTVMIITVPTIATAVLFVLYSVLFLVRQNAVWGYPFAYIKDAKTGNPVSYAVVRVSRAGTGETVAKRVADLSGKYNIPLPNGHYAISVDKRLADGTYQTVMSGAGVTVDRWYLADDLRI